MPNDYGQRKQRPQYFEAILLANKEPVEYEKSVPVQIKYRKEGIKNNKEQLIGKLITSQIVSQIASQKELIRTAILNVKMQNA